MHVPHVMSPPSPFSNLAYSYFHAVQETLTDITEGQACERAAALGEGARQRGLGVLDLTSIHQITMVKLLSTTSGNEEQVRVARVAAMFFHQCLEPFTQNMEV